jgi:hypothetical protein
MHSSISKHGSSTLTMVLFVMTLASSGLMYYWFQRCRVVEQQVAAWEKYRLQRGEDPAMPPVQSAWGRLSLSSLGTSTAQAIQSHPIQISSVQLTRPADVVHQIEEKAAILDAKIQKATDAAARMAAVNAAIPLAERLLPAAGSAPVSDTLDQDPAPQATPTPVAEAPAVENRSRAASGPRRDPGPGADWNSAQTIESLDPIPATDTATEAAPVAAEPQPLRAMDDTATDALAAAPTPAPTPRRTKIRSVYDLEEGSAASASRPRPQSSRPAAFSPARQRMQSPNNNAPRN